jgi:hypothetical protein
LNCKNLLPRKWKEFPNGGSNLGTSFTQGGHVIVGQTRRLTEAARIKPDDYPQGFFYRGRFSILRFPISQPLTLAVEPIPHHVVFLTFTLISQTRLTVAARLIKIFIGRTVEI